MVKIRLRRMGNKHRPFYRIVVAKSAAGRDGSFIEVLGTYNSLTKPSTVKLDGDRALHWLMNGAQPTETAAILLKREGVLDKFFEARPQAKGDYKFLDKRTEAMSAKSMATTTAVAEPEPAPKAAKPTPAPAEEPAAEPVAEPVADAAAEDAPAQEGAKAE